LQQIWGIAVSASFELASSLEIESSTGSYSVGIESGSFERSLRHFEGAAIIADEFFRPAFERAGVSAIFIEATEANKSLDASPAIIERIRKAGANRQTELLAVGGGIIQDLSAFIASVYMRGLRWSYVPTTVLAMVDSCIGGKSSINVGPYKNLAGTIHPPERVLIDPALAATLPNDQKASGLIEAAKICFCRGEESFARHVAYEPSVHMSAATLEPLIVNSLTAKKWFIERDEFDKKERLLLNFGHTFGHAIEGATHFAISHGIAVGLGILCANEFERQRGVNYTNVPRVKLLEEHLHTMISEVPNLAEPICAIDVGEVIERFGSDKKHGPEHFTLILIAENGDVVLRKIEKTNKATSNIERAIKTIVKRYS
jgi:3-dehydroquinate synthase